MLYSSLENKKIKDLKKLSLKKYRDEFNLFLVEGKHLVEEAYKTGYLKELLITENSDYTLDVETNYLSDNVMKYLSNLENPSEVIGVCEKKLTTNLGNRILLLDEIQDPGNLGTIIRSAKAFNIETIVVDKCADVYSDKVIRASQGMIFNINILNKNLKEIIIDLKEKNYQIIGTKVKDAIELKTLEKKDKFAIIMGNEGNGVRKELLDLCDDLVYINMNDACESLNVAVATSIILYWVGD